MIGRSGDPSHQGDRRRFMESTLIPLTIWTALVAYAIGERGRVAPPATGGEGWARLVWSAGAVLYLAHVAAAFDRAYGWSHAAAHAHTAEQTAALVGTAWGGGIWVNYVFTALWAGEALWWWAAPARYRARPRALEYGIRAMFLFMIVNGAVVFVTGYARWMGLVVVAVVCGTWFRASSRAGGPARGVTVSSA
jgi:hypothetical protein